VYRIHIVLVVRPSRIRLDASHTKLSQTCRWREHHGHEGHSYRVAEKLPYHYEFGYGRAQIAGSADPDKGWEKELVHPLH
jgi:LPS sulfotransferase NodH